MQFETFQNFNKTSRGVNVYRETRYNLYVTRTLCQHRQLFMFILQNEERNEKILLPDTLTVE